MLKKTVAYTDYNGSFREEDYYFNLTKAELIELELSLNGGLTQLLEKIAKERDSEKIVMYFKKVMLMAYGEKSLDGKHFLKSDEASAKFACSAAYDAIFSELMTDANKASAFINGLMPEEVRNVQNNNEAEKPALAVVQAST